MERLGRLLGCLGGLLGRPWGLLGRLEGLLGRLGGLLGRLGVSWAVLGAIWGPIWDRIWTPDLPKLVFFLWFLLMFAHSQTSTKIHKTPGKQTIFVGFGPQVRPQIGPKSIQNRPPGGIGGVHDGPWGSWGPGNAQDLPGPLPTRSQDLPGPSGTIRDIPGYSGTPHDHP